MEAKQIALHDAARERIVAVDGKPVDTVQELLGRLDDFKVGEAVRLTLLRGRARVDGRVSLQPGA